MKTTLFRLSCLIVTLMPMALAGQTNIKTAFDAIIKCPEVKMTETRTLDKDPDTHIKTGQSEVYDFVLPANKMKLVKNVLTAFDKDSEVAYSLNSGRTTGNDGQIQLVVGDGTGRGVSITENGRDYIYALFLPTQEEDPDGKFRYAYGINYREDGDNIVGRLVVTYGTTLKYRQELERDRQMSLLRKFSNGSTGAFLQDSWFDTLITYFRAMPSASPQNRIALATKAYKVIRDSDKYTEVTDVDKNAIREILKGMISDKKYSETVLNKLLLQCKVALD